MRVGYLANVFCPVRVLDENVSEERLSQLTLVGSHLSADLQIPSSFVRWVLRFQASERVPKTCLIHLQYQSYWSTRGSPHPRSVRSVARLQPTRVNASIKNQFQGARNTYKFGNEVSHLPGRVPYWIRREVTVRVVQVDITPYDFEDVSRCGQNGRRKRAYLLKESSSHSSF